MKKIFVLALLQLSVSLAACSDAPSPPKSSASVATVKVVKWGPQGTKAGQGFAVQPNGNSAIWFEQTGIHSAESAEVWFGSTQLTGKAITPNQGGSAEIPPALISKPGRYPVFLILKEGGQRVEIGTFEVTP